MPTTTKLKSMLPTGATAKFNVNPFRSAADTQYALPGFVVGVTTTIGLVFKPKDEANEQVTLLCAAGTSQTPAILPAVWA